MNIVRLLIVLAVALAVPLQGVAAVSAGQCMAFGHHEQDMAAAHGAQDGHADHAHGEEANGPVHHAAPDGDAAPEHDDFGAEHCAPCVACCAAATIAPSLNPVIPDEEAGGAVVLAGRTFSGVAPKTLDRPPLFL